MLRLITDSELSQKTEYNINLEDIGDIIHTLVRKVAWLENMNRSLDAEVHILRDELNKTINFNNTAKDYFLGENNTQ